MFKKGASGYTYDTSKSGSLGKDMARNLMGYTPKVTTQTINTGRKTSKLPSLPKGGKYHPEY